MRWFLISLVLLSGGATAQELAAFLASVQTHPAVAASAAAVAAARTQLEAVYGPVSFSLSGNYTHLNLDLPDTLPEGTTIPENLVGLELGASFRPFVFGDIGDLAAQRQIELLRSELAYRETLTTLETQALEAAAQVVLAEASLTVAEQGRTLSQQVLQATRTRQARGAASAAEVRSAARRVTEAEDGVTSALRGLELTRQSLVSLVGDGPVPVLPDLAPATGAAPAVLRAEYDLSLAQIGVRSAGRALYPTAQARYTWPLSDERSEVALSLESRTLQPTLTYSYANPKTTTAGFSVPEGVPASALKGSFTVGVGLDISPEAFASLEAATTRVTAAEAGLEAARASAELNARSLENTLDGARRSTDLAAGVVRDAEATLAEVQARLELGLATDLDLAQADLALAQARLNLARAKLEQLQSILATYRAYALPPSEVLE